MNNVKMFQQEKLVKEKDVVFMVKKIKSLELYHANGEVLKNVKKLSIPNVKLK